MNEPPTMQMPVRVWLTTREAGEYLGMSERQFARIATEHNLSASRPSSQCPRYKVDDIDGMMDSLREQGR